MSPILQNYSRNQGGPHHRFARFGTLCGKIFTTQQPRNEKIWFVVRWLPIILEHPWTTCCRLKCAHIPCTISHPLRWPTSWSRTVVKSFYCCNEKVLAVAHLYSLLLDTLPLYIIYPRILKETKRSIRYLESECMVTLEDVVPPKSGRASAFLQSWRRLHQAIQERELLESASRQSKEKNNGMYLSLMDCVCANDTVMIFSPFQGLNLSFLLAPPQQSFLDVRANEAMFSMPSTCFLFSGLPTGRMGKWPPRTMQSLVGSNERQVLRYIRRWVS
jgi:hypothetical protein